MHYRQDPASSSCDAAPEVTLQLAHFACYLHLQAENNRFECESDSVVVWLHVTVVKMVGVKHKQLPKL